MVVNIEDAGFEIRDCIQWIYGSGFPKSMDIAKAFVKSLGVEREVIGYQDYTTPNIKGNSFNSDDVSSRVRLEAKITASTSALAKQWDGWGTALKPANEPIVLARKPLIGTVVENVLKHGVGGINIDACRIDCDSRPLREVHKQRDNVEYAGNALAGRKDGSLQSSKAVGETNMGRFPANVILDKEAGSILDIQSGLLTSGNVKEGGFTGEYSANVYSKYAKNTIDPATIYADTGGASRFFYCAKTSKKERMEAKHPTIKPINLMKYLIKLITPPNGIILDPFAGSMTTAIAAMKLGHEFVCIERDKQNYIEGMERFMKYKQTHQLK